MQSVHALHKKFPLVERVRNLIFILVYMIRERLAPLVVSVEKLLVVATARSPRTPHTITTDEKGSDTFKLFL